MNKTGLASRAVDVEAVFDTIPDREKEQLVLKLKVIPKPPIQHLS
jgi:hypothetical protein